jgi:hypothetical protein
VPGQLHRYFLVLFTIEIFQDFSDVCVKMGSFDVIQTVIEIFLEKDVLGYLKVFQMPDSFGRDEMIASVQLSAEEPDQFSGFHILELG